MGKNRQQSAIPKVYNSGISKLLCRTYLMTFYYIFLKFKSVERTKALQNFKKIINFGKKKMIIWFYVKSVVLEFIRIRICTLFLLFSDFRALCILSDTNKCHQNDH